MLVKNDPIQWSHSKEDILAHIERMVQDSSFFSSNILKRFLFFIVNETLEGRSNCLKEYTIAVKVLEKPLDFKPQENGIVRIHAGRLRRALSQYYGKSGAGEQIRILIPKGNYVPVFENASRPEQDLPAIEYQPPTITRPAPARKIKVGVLPFRCCSEQNIAMALANGLGFQLTAALQQVSNISVVAFQMIKNMSEHTDDLKDLTSRIGSQFFLTGGVETLNDRIRVSIELIKGGSFEQIWSDFFDKRISQSHLFDLQDEIIKSALVDLRRWFNSELPNLHKVALMPVSRAKELIAQVNL